MQNRRDDKIIQTNNVLQIFLCDATNFSAICQQTLELHSCFMCVWVRDHGVTFVGGMQDENEEKSTWM